MVIVIIFETAISRTFYLSPGTVESGNTHYLYEPSQLSCKLDTVIIHIL